MQSLLMLAASDTSLKVVPSIKQEIEVWLSKAPPKSPVSFASLVDNTLNVKTETLEEAKDWLQDPLLAQIALSDDGELGEQRLGIALTAKKAFHLKDPLNFLFRLAQSHRCEFVVLSVDPQSQQEETVCYFGVEEGRPDMYEVAQYLGL